MLNARAVSRIFKGLASERPSTASQAIPQLRHLGHAWALNVHSFQAHAVANAIAAMESSLPRLTTGKAFYIEISRARDRAELLTDNALA